MISLIRGEVGCYQANPGLVNPYNMFDIACLTEQCNNERRYNRLSDGVLREYSILGLVRRTFL